MTEFLFNFRPQYTELVERYVYIYEGKGLNCPNHVFQCKPNGRIICLLCKILLENDPLNIEYLDQHLTSSDHQKSCNVEAFNSYHNIFMQFHEDDHYVQVYFTPLTSNSVFCETCLVEILENEIIDHANSDIHFELLTHYFWHTEIIPNNLKLEEVPMDYSKLGQVDILPHRLQTNTCTNCPLIIQKVGNLNFCILCQDQIESLKVHFETKKHTSLAQRAIPLKILWTFHNYWIKRPVQIQSIRRYFLPKTFKKVRCVICHNQIKYAKIASHIALCCKNLDIQDSLYEPELDLLMVSNIRMEYSDDIKLTFYPHELMNNISYIENLNMFTIQRLLGNTQCLLCQELLEGVMLISEVLDHVKTQAHQSKLKSSEYVDPLVAYHEFWMQQDVKLQISQQFFRPCLNDGQYCLKCQQQCKSAEIIEHIKLCQKSSGSSFGKSSTNNSLQIAKDTNYSSIEPQIQINDISNNLETNLREIESNSACHPNEFKDGKYVDEINDNTSLNSENKFCAKQINYNSPTQSSCTDLKENERTIKDKIISGLGEMNVDSSDNVLRKCTEIETINNEPSDDMQEIKREVLLKNNTYDNKIMNTLYPHFKSKKRMNLSPSKYYFQKRSRFESFCLYCNISFIENSNQHEASKKHMRKLNDSLNKDRLESYHRFWLAQPSDMQQLQVYFNPIKSDTFFCILCKQLVLTQNVIQHPCLALNNKFEHYAVVEQYRKFEVKYHTNIAKTYFSRTSLEVTKLILNSEMPIVMHLESRAYCFLCGRKILRNIRYWYKHLFDHCSDMEDVHMKLPCILEYHRFWEQQSSYWQVYMIHYVPFRVGEMKCAKKHFVPYDTVFEHTKQCPVEDSSKISKLHKAIEVVQQSPVAIKSKFTTEQLNTSVENSDSLNGSCTPDTCDNLESSINDENSNSESEYSESENGTDDDSVENLDVKPQNTEENLNPAERELMMEIGKLAKKTINLADAGNSYGSDFKGPSKLTHEYPYIPGTSKVDIPVETKEYDNETIIALYSNYNNINRSRRPSTYFLQKRSNFERYCLLCCTSVIGIPLEHLKSKKHVNRSNGHQFKLLQSYHDFWMDQSPDVQLLQVNFNPHTLSSFYCRICKKPVAIKDVIKHPCLTTENKYEHFEVPEVYRKYEFKYNTRVKTKFFSKSFLEVTRTVLNTEMPLFLHFQGKACCLLCGKRIYRDLVLWNKHLLEHCKKIEQVYNRLPYILQYHQFWEQQLSELQICMVHYVPDFKGALKCAKHHAVLYDQTFEHTKECPIDFWDKLIKLCHKDIPLESSSAQESPLKHKAASIAHESFGDELDHTNNGKSSLDMHNTLESLKKEESCIGSESDDDDVIFSESAIDTDELSKKKVEDNNSSKIRIILTPAEMALMEQITKIGNKQNKQHNLIPSVDNNQRDHVFDSIPNRLKFEILNLNESNKLVNCKLCNINIGTTLYETLFHIVSPKHLSHGTKIQKREYNCDVCKQKFKNENKWLSHMVSTYHKLFCDKYTRSNDTVLQEYECLTCLCVLFGDDNSALRHKAQKKFKKKKPITLKREVLELFSKENHTEKLAIKLRKNILLNEQKDAQLVKACLKGFEDALKKVYPDCVAYPFGSRVTGIGSSKSDLDVFIDIGNMYYDSTNQKTQQDIVLRVKKVLTENRKKFSDICAITNARTPIIRVVHTITNIDCDLSFRHGLSVENTKFISFCFDMQPVTRLAMLTLKRWADIINLKDEITSYALCMMFIFYMQVNGYLLSVQRLRELTNKNVQTIDNWEIIDYTKSAPELIQYVKTYDGTVFKLLKDFFKMYSEFEFEKLVVCPLLGRTILVQNFQNNGDTLPPEMAKFASRLKSDPECQFKVSSMCVQDPFDLAHNLTKAIFKSYREKFTMLCELTYIHMVTVS